MNQKKGGYIALVSVLVISALLLVVTWSVNARAFEQRFNVVAVELKEQSRQNALSCAGIVLLRLGEDMDYVISDENVSVLGGECVVHSVTRSGSFIEMIVTSGVNEYTTTLTLFFDSLTFSFLYSAELLSV